jgi:hypothetical protein
MRAPTSRNYPYLLVGGTANKSHAGYLFIGWIVGLLKRSRSYHLEMAYFGAEEDDTSF